MNLSNGMYLNHDQRIMLNKIKQHLSFLQFYYICYETFFQYKQDVLCEAYTNINSNL